MIDALVEYDLAWYEMDDEERRIALEEVSRYGTKHSSGWESYSDEALERDYKDLILSNS